MSEKQIYKMNYFEFCRMVAEANWKSIAEVKSIAHAQMQHIALRMNPTPKEAEELAKLTHPREYWRPE